MRTRAEKLADLLVLLIEQATRGEGPLAEDPDFSGATVERLPDLSGPSVYLGVTLPHSPGLSVTIGETE